MSTVSLNHETSDAIRIARTICILSMLSVHVWPGASQVMQADSWASWMYEAGVYYLGRGSVPLLSTVSGVLLALSADRHQPEAVLLQKARTLIYPMMLWSALLLLLYGAHAAVTGDSSRLPLGVMGWANAFLGLTTVPANEPLGFLRDVFVAVALGLVGIRLYRRSALAGTTFLITASIAELAMGGVIFLRPQILAFFSVGILIKLNGRTNFVPPIPVVLAALAADIAVRELVGGEVANSLNRIAMSLLIWRCAIGLSRARGAFGNFLRRLEPSIFITFCSHMLTVALVAGVVDLAGIESDDPWTPLIWLVQFPLIVGVGVAIHWVAGKSGTLALLTGGRG